MSLNPFRWFRRDAVALGAALILLAGASSAAAQDPPEVHHPDVAPEEAATVSEVPPAANREKYQLAAVRVDEGPSVDGSLSDDVWRLATVVDAFVQQEPLEGAPASERTEVRLIHDGANLYLGILAFDSSPESVRATDMRRDGSQILNEDNFQVILDTFMDSRSAYMFVVNPLGAMLDQQVFEEGEGRQGASSNLNREWDGVWEASARRTPEGWSAEVRIPMVTLRFPASDPQSWGINFMRNIAHKNEVVFWAPIPRAFSLTRVSLAGTLTGLQDLDRGRDLRVKPYLVAGARSSSSGGASDRSGQGDGGLDIKYGITPSLNLDVTINTDFAQAEADNEQVNLTRFPLFFPEKRDFFLENSGQFSVATAGDGQRADLFFSRQIGILASGEQVPIVAGARLTGKVGQNNLAVMDIQTDEAFGQPGENFLVARYSRDILSRSKVGALMTNRQASGGDHYNRLYAADAALALGPSVSINGFVARTESPGIASDEWGGYLRAAWLTQAWYIYVDHTDLGDDFIAELGYVPRIGVRTTKLHLERTPRPGRWGIRVMQPMWDVTYTTDQTGRLLDRRLHHMVRVTFTNSASFTAIYNRTFERLDDPFRVRGISVAAGDYHAYDANLAFSSNPARRVSYGVSYSPQEYYDGERKDLSLNVGTRITSQLSASARYSRNDVQLTGGAFVTQVGSMRVDYTFSPALSLQTLTQYNSSNEQWSTSARLRYIYRPGSDLYVVYDEVRRDVAGVPVAEEFRDRQLIVKATYLLSL